LRKLVRDTRVATDNLILPLFVVEGSGIRRPIGSMPGVEQTSVDKLLEDGEEVMRLGIPSVILFGVPGTKRFSTP
jgi:porphobilinogen synthase